MRATLHLAALATLLALPAAAQTRAPDPRAPTARPQAEPQQPTVPARDTNGVRVSPLTPGLGAPGLGGLNGSQPSYPRR